MAQLLSEWWLSLKQNGGSSRPDRRLNRVRITQEMAKANGVNVYHYLTYLLEKQPKDSMSDEDLEQLAPWNEDVKMEIKRRTESSAE